MNSLPTSCVIALSGLIDRYLAGLMDPFVSVREVHRLLYFLHSAGEAAELQFGRRAHGPAAEKITAALDGLGFGLSGGFDATGDVDSQSAVEVAPLGAEATRQSLAFCPETLARFERVARLIEGFESSFGLDLLATVHWVVARESAGTDEEIVERTYAWNDRKRQFSRRQILLARDVLARQGWIESR